MVELNEAFKVALIEGAKALRGAERRAFMARAVRGLGTGGQRRAETELGWNRTTIRKGEREVASGIACLDDFASRGRRCGEERLPRLLDDIRDIVTSQSQADPRFRTLRLYTRLTAEEVRRQLVARKGYADHDLPKTRSIRDKLHDLGFRPTKVLKCRPKKKIAQTDAIFDRLKQINPEADGSDGMLRLSLDAKTAVKVGGYSRKGKSRVQRKAEDHDHGAKEVLTPYGILLPRYDDLSLYFTTSRVTSDFMVDVLDRWWQGNRARFPLVGTLVINQDNGPENKSRRTQFLKRMVGFARQHRLLVRLAYYPPYHSKYNPIEHCWGVLESHWNGDLLDSREAVLGFAESMTWNGKRPRVSVWTDAYPKGVRLPRSEMLRIEKEVQRLPNLDDWFVDIPGNEPVALG